MKWVWAALALGLLAAAWRWQHPPAPSLIDRRAPDFNLPALDSPVRVDSADLHGRVWVLNVWASWCGPCREEHALLMALAQEAVVPLVGLNTRDDPQAAREWLLRSGNPYLASASDAQGQVAGRYGVEGIPMSFVVDRDGIVRLARPGPLTRQAWTDEVMPLLRRLRG